MEGEVQEVVQEGILEGTDFRSRSAGDSMEECHGMSDREEEYSHNSGVARGMAIAGSAGLGRSNFDQDKRTWWAAMQNLCRHRMLLCYDLSPQMGISQSQRARM